MSDLSWAERIRVAAREMRSHEQPSYGQPATIEEISAAQKALNVIFPDSYKLLLRTFGIAVWPDYIYGLGAQKGLNVVEMTKYERESTDIGLPSKLVVVSPDGWGNHYCLDTARLTHDECPIVFWNHEAGRDQFPDTTHQTFLDWLEDSIHERMKWDHDASADEDATRVI